MAVKVQGNSVPAVQTQQTQQTQKAQQLPGETQAKASQQQKLTVPGGKDEFVGRPVGPIDIGGILKPKPTPSLSFGDRVTASGLSQELSSPTNQLRLALGEKSETITRDRDGTYRGPEGQPLAQVQLKDGNTAYVDPNTNQYYLTDEKPDLFGRVQTLPASNLPEGSQFSNSYFSDADVKDVARIAGDGSVFGPNWPPQPPHIPRDFPPYGPIHIDPILLKDQGIKG